MDKYKKFVYTICTFVVVRGIKSGVNSTNREIRRMAYDLSHLIELKKVLIINRKKLIRNVKF